MVYQWILAAIFLLIPAWVGYVTIAYFQAFRERTLQIVVGSTFGIAVFGTILYALAHLITLQAPSIWILVVMAAAVGIALQILRQTHPRATKYDNIAIVIGVLGFALFACIAPKLLIEKSDGLYTGIINAYGDVAWHSSLITEFATQKSLPLQDPIFAGIPLTYPFLSNLVSGAMIIIGSSLAASLDVPAIILIPITLVLLYHFGTMFGASKRAGIITMLLFLFGGATFGFIRFLPDLIQSGQSLGTFILHLPNRDYSGVGGDTDGFNFLNPVTTLLLPQRAMLFGLPIVLSVLILLYQSPHQQRTRMILAGILAGTLPLYHAHACIALACGIIGIFFISHQKKSWVSFIAPALVIGLPELSFYAHGDAVSGSFFRFAPWWMKGDKNFFLFWAQNTGIVIPASIAGLFMHTPKHARALALSGIALFIISNTFLFAPWAWDNFKLLVFWFLFSLPLIAWLAVYAWDRWSNIVIRAGIFTLLLIQILSGALDILKLSLPTATTWQEWGEDAVQFARYVQEKVPPTAPVLTASVHNSPVVLSGRLLFLGYPAHVWSHGVLPWAREQEIKDFYAGLTPTIDGVQPHYIVVGPQEIGTFTPLIERPQWQKIAQYGPYSLFRQ